METNIEKVNEFRELVRRLENNDFAGRAADSCRFIHSTLGLVTETAELEALLESGSARIDDQWDLDVKDEVGDIIFYLLQGQDCFRGDLDANYVKFALLQGSWRSKLIRSVGEVADILKKHLVCNRLIDVNRLNNWYENIWGCLENLVCIFDFTLEECIVVTSAKLNYRYPAKTFSCVDRANRNREGEREVMLAALEEYSITNLETENDKEKS